jgi:hypothetical protein
MEMNLALALSGALAMEQEKRSGRGTSGTEFARRTFEAILDGAQKPKPELPLKVVL